MVWHHPLSVTSPSIYFAPTVSPNETVRSWYMFSERTGKDTFLCSCWYVIDGEGAKATTIKRKTDAAITAVTIQCHDITKASSHHTNQPTGSI